MNPAAIDTARRPFVLVWELTQACDLACKHCRAKVQPDRHPDELTTEEGMALLEEICEFGENQLVVLSGGDPLAREDAIEFVDYGTDLGLSTETDQMGVDHPSRSRTPSRRSASVSARADDIPLANSRDSRDSLRSSRRERARGRRPRAQPRSRRFGAYTVRDKL